MIRYEFEVKGGSPGDGCLILLLRRKNIKQARRLAEKRLAEESEVTSYSTYKLGDLISFEEVDVPEVIYCDCGER